MKPFLLVSVALLVLLPDIAAAQTDRDRGPPQGPPGSGRPPGHHDGGPPRPGPSHGAPATRPTPPHDRPVAPPPRPQPGRPVPGRPPEHRPGAGRPPNFHPVHGRPFRYPPGYHYRRWSIGLVLPSLFFAAPYYYDNYWGLGVGAPPPGFRWVRYGPDLLLVDMRTRRIRDVIYGAFY